MGKRNVVKLTEEYHLVSETCMPEEELNNEYAYFIAQRLLGELKDNNLISQAEYDDISKKNKEEFKPYLAPIMP